MSGIYSEVTATVGNTPLVRLNKVVPEGSADVYVKMEMFNPTGSYKDRMALAMSINNLLASPSFGPWAEGQPLDIAGLLHAPDGRPRVSVSVRGCGGGLSR